MDPSYPHQTKKKDVKVGPPLTKLSGSAYVPGTLLFYSQMKMRPGEKLIDKMDAVEDTKGNNGERGKKNYRLIMALEFEKKHGWDITTMQLHVPI